MARSAATTEPDGSTENPSLRVPNFDALLAERPRLRGRLHLATAIVSLGGLAWLLRVADSWEAKVAAWVYGLAMVLLYATSSTYHVFARSLRVRRVMQRLDHAMIYVLIAGTCTPICLLAMQGWWRWFVLGAIWIGAIAGVLLKTIALERFQKLGFTLYLVLGWAGLATLPALLEEPARLVLVATAGVLYTVGAVLFSLHWPGRNSRWFGYHEVWHCMVVAAGVLFFVVNLSLIESGPLT
jgi:hemolysin III